MRLLVIGTTSVLGSYLERAFKVEDEHEVRVAGRSSLLHLDLTNSGLPGWTKQARFDAVVNLAGIFASSTLEQEQEMLLVNAYGPLLSARIAQAVGAEHFVNVSTWYAQEPSSYKGNPAYPLTRQLGDRLLLSSSDGPPRVTVLRPTHIYDDAGACRPNQPALYWMVDETLAGNAPHLTEPDARRDYLHVDDFIAAVKSVLQQRLSGVYTVTSPQTHTFAHIAEAARVAVLRSVDLASFSDTGQAGASSNGNHLPIPNFSPSIPIEVGLERIVEAVRQ